MTITAETHKTVLMLMHTLLGVISPNFRMITLEAVPDGWEIWFYLDEANPDDEAEIEDVLFELDALQWPATAALSAKTIIGREPLNMPDWNVQYTAFKRRE